MINIKSHVSILNYILFQVDMVLFLLACFCTYGISLPNDSIPLWCLIYIIIASHISFFVADLYDVEEVLKKQQLVKRYGGAYSIFYISLVILSLFQSGKQSLFETSNNIELLFFSIIFLLSWRFAFIAFLSGVCPSQRILILGNGANARVLFDEIKKRRERKWNIIGFLGVDMMLSKEPDDEAGESVPIENLIGLVNKKDIDCIVVAIDQMRGKLPLDELLECKVKEDVSIIEFTGFYEKITGKIWVDNLRPSWVIFSSGFSKSTLYKGMKRIFDILCSFIILIVCSPAVVVAAILIKLTSKGELFFSQERIGLHGEPFILYKFRTMVENAEKDSGPVWAGENDSRVTAVGSLLRKWRVDEIPQIWNVLKGDMSFIGPRPERHFFIEQLKHEIPFYSLRLVVKPGITGWAAVKFQYASTIEDAKEKLKYDLYYIKSCSILLDFMIILKTINVVLYGKGSR